MNYRDALESTRGRSNRVLGDRFDRDHCRDRDDDVLGARRDECPKKKGTLLRIFIPAGAEINLLDIFEISSPGGICIVIRLPFLEKFCSKNDVAGIFDEIKRAGGRVEYLD